ncbi:DNA-binding SARP family transcriptional activator [Kitasatospora sp. SolWspMP-SS2h]|uniref:AfsR/SARP family transcriptional regulator n=1 Tax=Kitasatospora sp. SolWspMP-SS2h TaxID=1305729 RepID=UPI000DB9E89A|nr:AfsR/SARP family transcriptional regulator [Kitasatospora sp. SolWspMP-SS2h]RAJ39634.1 DNA-binding SARP family transcriptional activator [Kitasatospora sp. SolWspMP-SS2h]
MEITVLGRFGATENGLSVVPAAAKPRAVLALLALHQGSTVPSGTLMSEIWGEAPPRSADNTLQGYVVRLRRLIGAAWSGSAPGAPDPKWLLQTRPGGYSLDLAGGDIDMLRMQRLAASGYRAADGGDDARASALFAQALALWSGPALSDTRTGVRLTAEALRLENVRLSLLERRIAADMRLGRHHELIVELGALCAEFPLHEGLHAQLMRALHRTGGRWRALEVYQRLRTALIDQLGLDPCAEVRAAHQAVLESEAPAAAPARTPHPAGRPTPYPAGRLAPAS